MHSQDHIQLSPGTTLSSTHQSSPISELPIEIITQIFLFADHTHKLFQPPSSRVPPLQLCHVCHEWREIASGVPQLWDGLHLRQGELSKFNRIFGSAHEWLDRAKNKPLSFRFEWSTMTGNHNPASWITIPSGTCLHLHSVILQLTGNCSLPGMMHIVLQFEKAKALRRVCLLVRWQLNTFFPIPWSQLTHLYIPKALNYDTEWEDLLFTCVNLERGMFEIQRPPHQNWNPSTPRPGCLPRLREIALETPCLANPNMFHDIELPALKVLRISSTRELPMWRLIFGGTESLKIQLQSIESLSLTSTYSIPTGEIHRLFRDTPEVTELDLQLPPSDIAKILGNTILRSPSRAYFLPQLLVLKLELRHVNIFGFLHYLERFVRSRFGDSGTGVRLEKVVLFYTEDQKIHLKDTLEALGPFAKEGLKLEVRVMCMDDKVHWSNRLDSETVEWPEGLAIAVDCSNPNFR